MPEGFKFNSDLLTDPRDREAFAARFPQLSFAFDDPELREMFETIDSEALKAKRRSRTFASLAIGMVTLALVVGAFSPLLYGEDWFRPVLIGAAVLGVLGLIAGWTGAMMGNPRDEWLRKRFLCERIRQLHFQTLVAWTPLVLECAGNNMPDRFFAARKSRTEKFKAQVVNTSAVALADLLADRSADGAWLTPVTESTPAASELSASYFEALCELRLRNQQDFAGFQLLAFWTLRPKSALQTAKLLSGVGVFCALLALNLGVAGLILDVVTGRLAILTHAVMVALAVVALAARTLEEGLQAHRDVSRYRTYDAALRRLGERYRQATGNAERRAIFIELEELCFDEMVGFLKSHHEARFLM